MPKVIITIEDVNEDGTVDISYNFGPEGVPTKECPTSAAQNVAVWIIEKFTEEIEKALENGE